MQNPIGSRLVIVGLEVRKDADSPSSALGSTGHPHERCSHWCWSCGEGPLSHHSLTTLSRLSTLSPLHSLSHHSPFSLYTLSLSLITLSPHLTGSPGGEGPTGLDQRRDPVGDFLGEPPATGGPLRKHFVPRGSVLKRTLESPHCRNLPLDRLETVARLKREH